MPAQPADRRSPPHLSEPEAHYSTWFCGHCGERFVEGISTPISRVCPICELGLVLQTPANATPSPGDAFLVVDSSLSVQAVSAGGEGAIGVPEQQAVNRLVTEFLIPGDAAPEAAASLAVAITRAAGGAEADVRIAVRPSHTFGLRMLVRIDPCGPPRAALLTLEELGR